jgi:uncharacterized protein YkwD
MAGPSAAEQLLLEYINDARLDPMGDAARYISSYNPLTSPNSDIEQAFRQFGVSGSKLEAAFEALKPVEPVAWNADLTNAARAHSSLMIKDNEQSHQLPGEQPFDVRDQDAGYTGWTALGENIFAYATSPVDAQAAFMVDWGGTAANGGMQNPPGHRENIMDSDFREVGIGIEAHTPTSSNSTGPESVTEDFGTRGTSGVFLLGVAYDDTDKNGFYSIGEGLGTLKVSVGGQSVTSYASGGYTLPTSLTGAQNITFSGAGLSSAVTVGVTLAAGNNYKLDVINGSTLHTSISAKVTGPITAIVGLGEHGLVLQAAGSSAHTIDGTVGNDTLDGGTGADHLVGGWGADTLSGGYGSEFLWGGPGADHITGGPGNDVFYYAAVSDSTGTTHDTVTDFDALHDKFNIPGTVTGINTAMATGALSSASFNANLAADVNASHLAAHHAVEFTPSSGTLKGDHFLIVDENGVAGYQANADLVVALTAPLNMTHLATTDFV